MGMADPSTPSDDIFDYLHNLVLAVNVADGQFCYFCYSEDKMVDASVLKKLEEGYAKLAASNSKSLLKKYLTKEVFNNLKTKKTPSFGSTLLDVIQSGKLKTINSFTTPVDDGVFQKLLTCTRYSI
jgi:hypothetical protein